MGSQTAVFTFNVDQGMVALALALASALMGAVFMVYGALLLTRRFGSRLWGNRERFTRELSEWSGADPAPFAAHADEIMRQFRALNGWTILGAGLGWLLAVGGMCALALAATGTLASLLGSGAEAQEALQLQGVALGLAVGFIVGSRRATRLLPATPTYGDLRRRRAGDYCAWWLSWAPALVVLYAVVSLWPLATQTSRVTLTISGARWLAPTMAVVGVFLVLGALILLGAGLCVRWLAEAPRALLAADPQVARCADDYRRALGIGSILGMTWMSSAYLVVAARNVITATELAQGRPVEPLLTISFIVAAGAFFGGVVIMATRGRLGGHLTGWRRPEEQIAAVARPS